MGRLRGAPGRVLGLVYYAQTRVRRCTSGLHRVNVVALAANGAFIALHALQTRVFYDGTAQDVSIFSSQGSVVLLLVAVLLMENIPAVEYLLVAVLALLIWAPLRLARVLTAATPDR
ncbi:hypothetical protein [Saccharothrix texasensis]|uniref:hypothetical protein n=1 Tax=Saccharothrix texasensis TaxID=103734 RepID=UPI001B86F66A|nr:hypothetical protein [Saccharothrix texasensis]